MLRKVLKRFVTMMLAAAVATGTFASLQGSAQAAGLDTYGHVQQACKSKNGSHTTGICNVCSTAILLNRKLYVDGNTSEKYDVVRVLQSINFKNLKTVKCSKSGCKGRVSIEDTDTTNRCLTAKYRANSGAVYQANYLSGSQVSSNAKKKGLSNEAYVRTLLDAHPEGVEIHLPSPVYHAAVLTGYSVSNGKYQYYAMDPVNAAKVIKLEDSWLGSKAKKNGKNVFTNLDYLVYLTATYPQAPAPVEPVYVAPEPVIETPVIVDPEPEVPVYVEPQAPAAPVAPVAPVTPAAPQAPASTLAVKVANPPSVFKVPGTFNLKGEINSNYNITEAYTALKDANGNELANSGMLRPNTKSVNIQSSILNKNLKFGKIKKAGTYYLVVYAKDASGRTQMAQHQFTAKMIK